MTARENEAVVSRFYEEVCNAGDLTAADELVASDFVSRCNPPGGLSDREALKREVGKVRAAFDIHYTIEELVSGGDTVVARLRGRGRVKRNLLGLNLGHKQLRGTGVDVWRLRNGRIVERLARSGPA